MALTRNKLKKDLMKKSLEKSTQRTGGKSDDPRILPYYKLEDGEKVQIIMIPYEDGDLFKHHKKHGPNMNNPKAGSIDCIYHSRGESCPACEEGYSHVVDGKGTEHSRKWMAKDYYAAQVVVVEAPFDLPPLEDGNEARVFLMPHAVVEKIKEAFSEGIVDDPTEHILNVKKTTGKNGQASYANSFFSPKPFGDQIADVFEDAKIELHDLKEMKIEPEEVTAEEVEEWTEKAVAILSKSTTKSRRSESDDDDGDDDDKPARTSRKRRSAEEEEEEEDEAADQAASQEEDDDDGKEEPPAKKEKASEKGLSIQEKMRLRREKKAAQG